ncbi:MAG: hypothetical protein KGR26_02475, partial [Cyanobacteria bacterium REEB65]|nr:hypothetical protein [Cyanobacteria bacterium REEB65]
YSRKLREERQRLASAMIQQVRRVLDEAAQRYRQARAEIAKQRDYIDHFGQLAQRKEITLGNQLRFALARIDDLSLERKAMRQELGEQRRQIWDLEARLRDISDQEAELAALRAQWQEMIQTNTALANRLEQTEAALDKAQSALGDTLAKQTLSTAREVDDLRSLVVSLQLQTEALRSEIATHQEAMQNQERFIALLKQGDRPSVRPFKRLADDHSPQEGTSQA